ncbi:YkvA family protein [Effusibacillus consociatus]|uniref:YkvA family protein n=1 Tax=Effusibacillus consociatus TaxID=1117041 RepID=A0ABV9PXQ1_9BACL
MEQKKGFFNRVGTNLLGMMRDKQTPRRDKFLMVAGILYFISPIDLIPEGLLTVFGYTDDLAVLIGTFSLIRKNYKRYVERRHSTIIDVTDYE